MNKNILKIDPANITGSTTDVFIVLDEITHFEDTKFTVGAKEYTLTSSALVLLVLKAYISSQVQLDPAKMFEIDSSGVLTKVAAAI